MTDTATPNSITFQIETEDGILTAEVAMAAVDTFDLRETMLIAALVGAVASGEDDFLAGAACASAVTILRTHPELDPMALAQAIHQTLIEVT